MEQNEYNCDFCETYVPDGEGLYTDPLDGQNSLDSDRVCVDCFNKYNKFVDNFRENLLTLRQKRV
jgi:hypothetical protein